MIIDRKHPEPLPLLGGWSTGFLSGGRSESKRCPGSITIFIRDIFFSPTLAKQDMMPFPDAKDLEPVFHFETHD